MSKNYTKYMNRVELSGTVQWDPIINHQERDGVQLTKASYVIVTENGFDENGREIREYVSVEAQGRRGQDVEQFLKKDMTVRILGRVRRSSTLTRNGEKVWTNNGGSDPGSVIEIANTSSNDLFMKLCKEQRQIIVVTHNANIPVNGDAEYIISMDSQSLNVDVRNAGTIDNTSIRKEICDVMEGTEYAFEMRAKKYHLCM